jgi:hypothetical protein
VVSGLCGREQEVKIGRLQHNGLTVCILVQCNTGFDKAVVETRLLPMICSIDS